VRWEVNYNAGILDLVQVFCTFRDIRQKVPDDTIYASCVGKANIPEIAVSSMNYSSCSKMAKKYKSMPVSAQYLAS
jgi:hypothetical protein